MPDAQGAPKSLSALLTEIDTNLESLQGQMDRLRSVRQTLSEAAKYQEQNSNAEELVRRAMDDAARAE